MLKILALVVAGVLTIIALKRVMEELQFQRARKAKVKSAYTHRAPRVTQLREDPRTGIYYPDA